MEDVKRDFIKAAKSVTEDNALLAKATLGVVEMLYKKSTAEHKLKIEQHFQILIEIDDRYANLLNAGGALNDISLRNAQIQIVTFARSMFVGAILDYGSSITAYEGQVQFRINTVMALVALVVSILGVGLSVVF